MILVPRSQIVVTDPLEGREADSALLESIEANGILNPLRVYSYAPEGYEPEYHILDGHRRLRAADQLGIEELPIEITEPPEDEAQARMIQVILNRNRKDVKPSHVAESILMLKESGVTQKEIAKRFGLSQPQISTYLTLQRGHEKIRRAVDSGRMSLSAAEPLLTRSLEIQDELADAAIRQRTVRAVRALVKTHELQSDLTAPIESSDAEGEIDPLEYLALEEFSQAVETITTYCNGSSVEHPSIRAEFRERLTKLQWALSILEREFDND